ncbi:MAG: DUF2029 domain-containing protein [Anaerolineaceae bacterium]|nr:DUF2029 domain-containing protein [Anaerolineaceae bacterium]
MIFILIILVGFVFYVVPLQDDLRNRDFFTFWLSGRLMSEGKDPYDSADWIAGHERYGSTWLENDQFCYPLILGWLLIPIGILPLEVAAILWSILSIAAILASTYFTLTLVDRTAAAKYLMPCFLLLMVSRSNVLILLHGQIDAFLLFLICYGLLLTENNRWGIAGVCLAFIALKPQIGLIILMYVGIWGILQRKWKFIGSMILSGGVMIIISFLIDAEWVIHFMEIVFRKSGGNELYFPNLRGLASAVCWGRKICVQLIWYGAAAVLNIGGLLWMAIHRKTLTLLSVSSIAIFAALLSTAYVWNYDYLFLTVPILQSIMLNQKRTSGAFLETSGLLGIYLLMSWGALWIAMKVEHDVFSLCLLFTALIFWAMQSSRFVMAHQHEAVLKSKTSMEPYSSPSMVSLIKAKFVREKSQSKD